MECCKISAGDLRTLIYIQRLVRTSDNYGGAIETWEDDPPEGLWASVRSLTGTEAWEANRVIPGNLKKVITRFRGDSSGAPYYSSSDKMLIRGREHAILSVVDIEERNIWLEFYVQESRAS